VADTTGFTADSTAVGCWKGVYFADVSTALDSSRIEYCNFEYAKGIKPDEDYYYTNFSGGALTVFNSSRLVIANSLFTNNVSKKGAAILCMYNASPQIYNNIFYNNTALYTGSAIYNYYSHPSIVNNTIVDNKLFYENLYEKKSPIENFHSKPLLANNIIRDNVCTQTQLEKWKLFYTYNNNISGIDTIHNNIDVEPGFADPEQRDYSLHEASGCINKGALLLPFFGYSDFDYAGNSRIYGDLIDIGAYEYDGGSAIESNDILASSYDLGNYPNPFNPSTTISFTLRKEIAVKLCVYDVQGRRVAELAEGLMERGTHKVKFNAVDLSSGVYYSVLDIDGKVVSNKMLLVK